MILKDTVELPISRRMNYFLFYCNFFKRLGVSFSRWLSSDKHASDWGHVKATFVALLRYVIHKGVLGQREV